MERPVDPEKLARAYNKVLKFGATHSDLEALLKHARNNPDELLPGSHLRSTGLPDALREQGRDSEADLLQSPHSVYSWRGKFYRADPEANPTDREMFTRGYMAGAVHSIGGGGAGGHQANSLIHPRDSEGMREDAIHFYHSYAPLLRSSGIHPYTAGHGFFMHRNGVDSIYSVGSPNPNKQELADAATQAGPYTLTQDRRWYVGKGGDHHWGQQPGLHE